MRHHTFHLTVNSAHKQDGAALAIALILLLVLTLSVLNSSKNVVMQERMTSSNRDATLSLTAAEAAIREAERFIETQTSLTAFGSTVGLYAMDTAPANVFANTNWTSANSILAGNTIAGTNTRYYIEDVGVLTLADEDLSGVNIQGYGETTGGGDVNVFKIVSRATGQSGNAERILVSYYGKRL